MITIDFPLAKEIRDSTGDILYAKIKTFMEGYLREEIENAASEGFFSISVDLSTYDLDSSIAQVMIRKELDNRGYDTSLFYSSTNNKVGLEISWT